MSEEKERFLTRWSRRKHEAKELPAAGEKEKQAEAPALPPVETLTPESDFTGFMHPKVEDTLRRVALKKLFSDPQFNVPDPFEPFSGDWTAGEAIPDEMLATLNQARTLLFDKKEEKEAGPTQAGTDVSVRHEPEPDPNPTSNSNQDEPGRKDA